MTSKQQKNWVHEYSFGKGVPTTTRMKPSSSVVKSLEYLHNKGLLVGNSAIDLGAGIGRNTFYLAEQGFDVTAVDFVPEVLRKIEDVAVEKNLVNKISTTQASIGTELPFSNNSFDLAIDIVSSISLNLDELKVFEFECRRILKPNGILISYVLSHDDGYLNDKIDEDGFHKEPNSGLIEKCFSENELRILYKNWGLLLLEKKEKEDSFFGKTYTRRLFRLILKNMK